MRNLIFVMFLAVQVSYFPGDGTPNAVLKSAPDSHDPIRSITFNDIDLTRLLEAKEISPEQVEEIPIAVTELDGKFVAIEGFMRPTFLDNGLTQFTLVEKRQF